jgi:hypothetical protein
METPNVVQPIQNKVGNLIKELPKKDFKAMAPYIGGIVLVVLLGIGTGWLISGKGGSSSVAPGAKVSSNEAGILDESTFKGDTAEGVLKEGGVNGDGTHHLEREGGASQTVYLASTVIDIQSFVGKKVQVWGETQSTKKAGWFMDVLKIKVIE